MSESGVYCSENEVVITIVKVDDLLKVQTALEHLLNHSSKLLHVWRGESNDIEQERELNQKALESLEKKRRNTEDRIVELKSLSDDHGPIEQLGGWIDFPMYTTKRLREQVDKLTVDIIQLKQRKRRRLEVDGEIAENASVLQHRYDQQMRLSYFLHNKTDKICLAIPCEIRAKKAHTRHQGVELVIYRIDPIYNTRQEKLFENRWDPEGCDGFTSRDRDVFDILKE